MKTWVEHYEMADRLLTHLNEYVGTDMGFVQSQATRAVAHAMLANCRTNPNPYKKTTEE